MELHYQSLGQGQPLILLHGLFGSADNWGTVAKHFSQSYQTISVDLRNHGRSPHSDSQTYTDMAEDLVELCDSLNVDTVHLLGHSLGGKVAMQFATQFPQRLGKLIVVDMAMRVYPDEHTHLINAMMEVDLSTIRTRSEVDEALSSTIDNAMVRQFLLMNLVKSDGDFEWRINLAALKANYPAMQQAVCESGPYNKAYDKPCLFIHGERSDYVRDDDIEQIKAYFIKAQVASLSTSHWVHAEQPQAFIQVVEQFLTN
ncbi:MAG: alpha/beta fold hydrolase [Methylophilaceae bacterium]